MGEPLIYIDSQKARDPSLVQGLRENIFLGKFQLEALAKNNILFSNLVRKKEIQGKKVPPTNEKNLTSRMPAFFLPLATASSDPHFHIAISYSY